MYLHPKQQVLDEKTPTNTGQTDFALPKGLLQFTYTIPFDLQLIGPMKLKLWLELIDCQDMNLFAGIRKFHQNKEFFFEGSYGYGYDIVTKGWQKLSLRTMAAEDSQLWKPEHDFLEQEFLQPGEIVCIELSLIP